VGRWLSEVEEKASVRKVFGSCPGPLECQGGLAHAGHTAEYAQAAFEWISEVVYYTFQLFPTP
jgi:hypothetical protein